MKQAIAWHEGCLKSMVSFREEARQAMERAKGHYERVCMQCALYERQIGKAKAKGKDDFDAERFKADEPVLSADSPTSYEKHNAVLNEEMIEQVNALLGASGRIEMSLSDPKIAPIRSRITRAWFRVALYGKHKIGSDISVHNDTIVLYRIGGRKD